MMSRIEIYNNIYNVNSYPSTSESELVRKVTDTPGKTAQTKPSLQVQGVEGKEMPMVSVRVVVGLGLERRRLDSTQIRSLCEIRTRGTILCVYQLQSSRDVKIKDFRTFLVAFC